MKIIPAIDLLGGSCVRLLRGDFDQSTQYSSNPTLIGEQFSKLAVETLHVVDLDGARAGVQENQSIVTSLASTTGLSLQLGGGIRREADVRRWLDAGVQRCVVGSMAVTAAETVLDWLRQFGTDKIVLALDVRVDAEGIPYLATDGWTADSGTSLWDCLEHYATAGATHVLCTDINRDGAMQGPNLELYEEILSRFPDLNLQASGGVRNIVDLQRLRDLGLPAAISGRALLDGAITESEVATFLRSA